MRNQVATQDSFYYLHATAILNKANLQIASPAEVNRSHCPTSPPQLVFSTVIKFASHVTLGFPYQSHSMQYIVEYKVASVIFLKLSLGMRN